MYIEKTVFSQNFNLPYKCSDSKSKRKAINGEKRKRRKKVSNWNRKKEREINKILTHK